ncbi:MAG: hypothetical protein ABJO36_06150 [Litorimonas sp.]
MTIHISQGRTEALLTLPKAAALLEVPVHSLRRAAKHGEFKTYSVFNGRVRARLSEIVAAIEEARYD